VPGGGVKGPKGTQSSQFAEQSILGHRRPQLHGQEPQQRFVAVAKKPTNGTELLQPNCVRAQQLGATRMHVRAQLNRQEPQQLLVAAAKKRMNGTELLQPNCVRGQQLGATRMRVCAQLHGQEPQQLLVAVAKKPINGTELLQPNCVRGQQLGAARMHVCAQLHGQEPQQLLVAVAKKPINGTELLQPNCVRAHTAEQSKAGRVLGSNAGRSCFIGVLQRFRLSRRPWETVIGETLTNCYIRYFGAHSRGLIFPFRNQAVCTQCVLHLDNGSLSHPERQLMNRKIIQALLSARVVENVAQWGLVKMAEIPVMCVHIRPFRQELAIINEVDESAQSLEMWRCRSEQFGFAEKVDDHVQVLLGRQTRAQLEISVRTLLPSFILDRDAYMAS
jgi:hypothetical protein